MKLYLETVWYLWGASMKRLVRWGIFLLIVAFLALLGRYLYLHPQLSLEAARAHSATLRFMLAERYLLAVLLFTLVGTIVCTTLLPIVSLVALVGGFLFGAFAGGFYTLVAMTIGTLLTFMSFKYFFANFMRERLKGRLETFIAQLQKHGSSYLLVLYLSALVPGFVLIPLAAVAKVSTRTFLWTTFLGNIPFVLVYAFAGKELGTITSVRDIFSPELMFAFLLLALIAMAPILMKKFSSYLRTMMVV